MISFERFTPEDGSPIYLQILRYIKRGAVAGSIADGDEMPSRRVLSALLERAWEETEPQAEPPAEKEAGK